MEYLSNLGKKMRFRRLIDPESGAILAVPMDHGFTLGPVRGVADIRTTTDSVFSGGASCIVIHKGIVRRMVGIPPSKGLMIHISGSVSFLPNSNEKVLTGSVDEAVTLGADAVSLHVNVGTTSDINMLDHLGVVTQSADLLGMPVLAMMYARDDNGVDSKDVDSLSHVARIAEEGGADIAKVHSTEGGKDFDEVVQGINIPVIIAGGSKTDNFQDFLKMIENCILAGASGVSIGRNIFQAENVKEATTKVVDVVRKAMKEQ